MDELIENAGVLGAFCAGATARTGLACVVRRPLTALRGRLPGELSDFREYRAAWRRKMAPGKPSREVLICLRPPVRCVRVTVITRGYYCLAPSVTTIGVSVINLPLFVS